MGRSFWEYAQRDNETDIHGLARMPQPTAIITQLSPGYPASTRFALRLLALA
jgi:hypothetical protein